MSKDNNPTWFNNMMTQQAVNLTWATRKHCTSSWLNFGQPEADYSSFAPTGPAWATWQNVSVQILVAKERPETAVMHSLYRTDTVPCDQSPLHSSHHSVQIWSHSDSWIESVDVTKQHRLIVRRNRQNKGQWTSIRVSVCLLSLQTASPWSNTETFDWSCDFSDGSCVWMLTCCPVYLRPSRLTFHSMRSWYCSPCPPQILTTKHDTEVSRRSGSIPKSRLRQVGFWQIHTQVSESSIGRGWNCGVRLHYLWI